MKQTQRFGQLTGLHQDAGLDDLRPRVVRVLAQITANKLQRERGLMCLQRGFDLVQRTILFVPDDQTDNAEGNHNHSEQSPKQPRLCGSRPSNIANRTGNHGRHG